MKSIMRQCARDVIPSVLRHGLTFLQFHELWHPYLQLQQNGSKSTRHRPNSKTTTTPHQNCPAFPSDFNDLLTNK
jgi:hypothetical protein